MSESKRIQLYVQHMDIVAPGDIIGEGEPDFYSPYIYVEGNKIYSSVLGIVEVKEGKPRIMPIHSTYIPQPNDIVIGVITDVGYSYWTIDINSPYVAQLSLSETPLKQMIGAENLRKFLDVGDYIVAKVISFERNKDPLLSIKGKELGRVNEGRVIDLKSSRVIWNILRRRKVIDYLEEELAVTVFVAANSRAWVKGVSQQAEDIAVIVLKKIDSNPFTKLTTSDISKLIMEFGGQVG